MKYQLTLQRKTYRTVEVETETLKEATELATPHIYDFFKLIEIVEIDAEGNTVSSHEVTAFCESCNDYIFDNEEVSGEDCDFCRACYEKIQSESLSPSSFKPLAPDKQP